MRSRDLFIPPPESLLSEPRHRVVARPAGGEIEEDAAHLEAGGGLVLAPARDPDERRIATEVLRDHGGTGMRYFGTTTWEEIG